MLEIRSILVFMSWIVFIECEMEPSVVGGQYANIKEFPHSVFMGVKCVDAKRSLSWICGGSILNELISLTAAHCVYGCFPNSTITVSVGDAHKKKGFSTTVRTYYVHRRYNPVSLSYDIALMKFKTALKFGGNVKKIAVMKNPPYDERAQVAGWGQRNDSKKSIALFLKYVDQYVWDKAACKQLIKKVPKGYFCASSRQSDSYCSGGDSGSALVVRGYIQIGIVSYKMPTKSKSLVVYTDTGYFYDWIQKHAKKLYCVIENKQQ